MGGYNQKFRNGRFGYYHVMIEFLLKLALIWFGLHILFFFKFILIPNITQHSKEGQVASIVTPISQKRKLWHLRMKPELEGT